MIELENHHYLLLDGDCGICTSFAEMARRMDVKSRFVIAPYQNYPEDDKKVGDYLCGMHAQDAGDFPNRAGVLRCLCLQLFFYHQFPWSLLLIPIYVVPIFLLLEIGGYALIAANRHRISRWLGLKACLVREKPAMPGTPENSDV